MKRRIISLTVLALAVALLNSPWMSANAGAAAPPQSLSFGKTLSQWMQLYVTSAFTGGPGQVGNVKLLPLPSGESIGGWTYDDPAIVHGHLDVALTPGTAFALPVIIWMGESYVDGLYPGYPEDPPLPARFFTDPSLATIKVYIDGKCVMDSTKNSVSPFYFGPAPLDVQYVEPSGYGSTGIVYVQGIGLVQQPLSVGVHTIELDAENMVPPEYFNPGVYPGGLGIRYINSWTITVSAPESAPRAANAGIRVTGG